MTSLETSAAAIPSDIDDKDEDLLTIFRDSTHGFLFNPSSKCEKVLSVYIILLQYVLYIIFIIIGASEAINGATSIEFEGNDCRDFMDSNDKNQFLDLMVCPVIDVNNDSFFTLMITVSIIVLSKFLLYDIIESIKGFTRSPIVAIALLIESLLAFIAGYIFIFIGLQSGSYINILMGAVTVIFAHDIDENVRKAVDRLPESKNWCKFVFPLVTLFIFSIIGTCIAFILISFQ